MRFEATVVVDVEFVGAGGPTVAVAGNYAKHLDEALREAAAMTTLRTTQRVRVVRAAVDFDLGDGEEADA